MKLEMLLRGYIGKSNPYIVFVSTPNAPGGSNPSFIRSLKHQLGEREDYEEEIKYSKTMTGLLIC
jgi:hypothetical protein